MAEAVNASIKEHYENAKGLRQGICADESRILEAHRNVFMLGVVSSVAGGQIAPIPEEMFQESLA